MYSYYYERKQEMEEAIVLTIKNYAKVNNLNEAWELNQKRSNRIIGGMLWTKMSNASIQTAIDLSGLNLNTIEETRSEFSIGCMVTLRQLEQHDGLNTYTQDAIRESVRNIVGVQFRNLATVGGSIFGRFGFSDVLTMFLALDSYVELFKGGIVPLQQFVTMPKDRDILVRLIIKKTPVSCIYLSHRNSKTDFPVLACAVSCLNGQYQATIGARPQKAMIISAPSGLFDKKPTEENVEQFSNYVKEQVKTGSNMRASAEYRSHLACVLTKRACQKLIQMNASGGKKK